MTVCRAVQLFLHKQGACAAYCKVVFVIFLSSKVIFAVLDVSSLPLQLYQTSTEAFYINTCSFISMDKFLYETQVLDNTYLRSKVQLPTSESTKITASGHKITLEGPVPLNAPSRKNYTLSKYFIISNCIFKYHI